MQTRAIILFFLLLAVGCTTRQGDFTILSTKNVEVSRVDLKHIDFKRDVTGSNGRFWLLFIPFGAAPTLEEACDDVLRNGNGDFMTSARIYVTSWHIGLVGYGSWKVIGDVGNSISSGAAEIEK